MSKTLEITPPEHKYLALSPKRIKLPELSLQQFTPGSKIKKQRNDDNDSVFMTMAGSPKNNVSDHKRS
jgi:hypothetical protein